MPEREQPIAVTASTSEILARALACELSGELDHAVALIRRVQSSNSNPRGRFSTPRS